MIIDFFADSNNKKAISLSIDGKEIPLKKCVSIEISCSADYKGYVAVKTTYGDGNVRVFNGLNGEIGVD